MGWIKRNLFFVISGVVGFGLLGAASFYIYQSWSKNSEVYDQLTEVVGQLKNLAQQKPSPGNNKINNTALAKEQEKELRAWAKSVTVYFQPVAAIPPEKPVPSEAFASGLRLTVDQLQREASEAGASLPPKYDFSFTAQRALVQFANGSLEPLAVQLGEVKAICEVLFAARINALDSIQRVRVSADDVNGPQSDYLAQPTVTNNVASITPYVVTFRCFTPELSRVICGFAACPNAFIIKNINVQPAGAASAMAAEAARLPGVNPVAPPFLPNVGQPPVAPVVPAASTGKGGLQIVLKEQLLRITLELQLVKLLPKS